MRGLFPQFLYLLSAAFLLTCLVGTESFARDTAVMITPPVKPFVGAALKPVVKPFAGTRVAMDGLSLETVETVGVAQGAILSGDDKEIDTATDMVEPRELEISRLGDLELSCGGLSQEAALMRDIISTTEDIKDSSKMKSRGIGVAGAAASFLIGTMTGGIGLAAAGFLIDYQIGEQADDADGVQDIAQQRRSLMMGVYNAKGCNGPIEHVMQDGIKSNKTFQIAAVEAANVEPAAGGATGGNDHHVSSAADQSRYND